MRILKQIVIIFITIITTSTLMSVGLETKINSTKKSEIIYIKKEFYKEFTEDNLKNLISKLHLKYPEIVYAQAVLESGHFKSQSFKIGNNLFGMKKAYRRPSVNIGEYLKHAKYYSWEESVIDYGLYQATFIFTIKSKEDYFNYLKKNYAGDPEYITKLKTIINNEKSNNNYSPDIN
jgi:flagellum-specific peptidoglycan hydrolase FlgJ